MSSTTTTMKLNHLSFPTTDLPATAAFFEKYLDFTISMKLGTNAYILKRPGFDVVLEKAGYSYEWPKNFHLGFELPTVNDVAIYTIASKPMAFTWNPTYSTLNGGPVSFVERLAV